METENWRNKLLIAIQGVSGDDMELWYPSGDHLENVIEMIELSSSDVNKLFEKLKNLSEFSFCNLNQNDLKDFGFKPESRKIFMHYLEIYKQSYQVKKMTQDSCKNLFQIITNAYKGKEK